MDENESKFEQLIRRLSLGSDEAAWELIETYGDHIRAVVRRRLNPHLRTRYDSDDFIQAVWLSFVRNPPNPKKFDGSDGFLKWLLRLASNKVIDEVRRLRTVKHDPKSQPLEEEVEMQAVGRSRATPSQVAIARESWGDLTRRLNDRDRRIIELRIAGETFREIAEELGCNEKTARRVVDALLDSHMDMYARRKAEGQSADPGEGPSEPPPDMPYGELSSGPFDKIEPDEIEPQEENS